MKKHLCATALALSGLIFSPTLLAQAVQPSISAGVAAKLSMRGDAPGFSVPEMRITRRGDYLSVQADVRNAGGDDLTLYYRFRWLDQVGNQHGNGDAWKQLKLLSETQQTLKGTGPHPSVSDFRLELSFESQ